MVKITVVGGLALLWGWLLRLLAETVLRLLPEAAAGNPAALAISLILAPQALYLAQALFYVPPKAGPWVPGEKRPASSPLLFLPWPFKGGPGSSFNRPGNDEQLRRSPGLAARLALLLDERSPLDSLLFFLTRPGRPLILRLLRPLHWLFDPARLFMRLWGWAAFLVWRRFDEPGPISEEQALERASVLDLFWRGRNLGLSPEDMDRLRRELARIYDDPAGGGGEGALTEDQPIYAEPFLAPRYKGAFLDNPATVGLTDFSQMYDDGPEEAAELFYTPELARELKTLAGLKAEARRLKNILSPWADRKRGLIWLDGRLVTTRRLEVGLSELEYQAARLTARLAAHNRRCRSSHLAAARRRGEAWAEALRGLGLLLFQAESPGGEGRSQALTELLKAEDAVCDPNAEPPEVPAASAFFLARPAAEEIPAAASAPDTAEYFGLGPGRVLSAAFLTALLLWKAQSLGLVGLTIYNGLGCRADVSVSGRHFVIDPARAVGPLPLEPGRLYHFRAACGDALIEDFYQRANRGRGLAPLYSIAAAAPLMEWGAGEDEVFLGRPRWLLTGAAYLFSSPPDNSARAISGYAEAGPDDMLAAFDDPADKEALIRLHARWDEPGSPWFWQWQILMTALDDQAQLLLDRLAADPGFLDRAGDSLTDYQR